MVSRSRPGRVRGTGENGKEREERDGRPREGRPAEARSGAEGTFSLGDAAVHEAKRVCGGGRCGAAAARAPGAAPAQVREPDDDDFPPIDHDKDANSHVAKYTPRTAEGSGCGELQ